ncbi:MAG TPA: SusC/RagA family TonB-linked outer membrane protein [Puia sp.]
MAAIERQTGYTFLLTDLDEVPQRKITVHVNNVPLDEVLNKCLQDWPLTWKLKVPTILMIRKIPEADTVGKGMLGVGGFVLDSTGAPIEGVVVTSKRGGNSSFTSSNGEFFIRSIPETDTLVFSGVNVLTQEKAVGWHSWVTVVMKSKVSVLTDVTVYYNTGYVKDDPNRATGSIGMVNNATIDRTVSSNMLDHMENTAAGVLFNHVPQGNGNTPISDPVLIRGISTILAGSTPLIIVDNFPYDGSLSNINPNDIESFTILKDAAASAIWGARAGNGVIVITTKRGRISKTRIEINSNITYLQRPDVFNNPMIASSDFIDLEKDMFNQGLDAALFAGSDPYSPITPVIALLKRVQDGTLSSTIANARIETLKGQDVRKDVSNHLYTPALNEQESLHLSGGTATNTYYLSVGFDHDPSTIVGSVYDRLTGRLDNELTLGDKFQVGTGLNLTYGHTVNGDNPGMGFESTHGSKYLLPYARLVNAAGAPLDIYADYRKSFIKNAEQQGLPDWTYSPVGDIFAEKHSNASLDLVLSTNIGYKITHFLELQLKYQYENQTVHDIDGHAADSYYTRDLYNLFSHASATGSLVHNLPAGNIRDMANTLLISQQGRMLLDFKKVLAGKHFISGLIGGDIKSTITTGNTSRIYGYDPQNSTTNSALAYTTIYQLYIEGEQGQIPYKQGFSKKVDNFLSAYSTVSYTYDNRYITSGSLRFDQANLFGASTNQKGVPLWSVGESWIISKESFYHLKALSSLKLRVSYGLNGNISRLTTAFTTADYYNGALTTPLNTATIITLPNKDLRWEKIRILNIGIDFATPNNRISGSLEVYRKNGSDLLGQAPVDPTLGLTLNPGSPTYLYSNIAGVRGKGIDFHLITHNLNGKKFKWITEWFLSNASSVVTKYLFEVGAGNAYLNGNVISPVKGRPLYALYSFEWKGLDPTNGDPRGWLGGRNSKEWANIWNNTPLDSMHYSGPAQPTYFGSVCNTWTRGRFSFSVNIGYKFGYFFRRPSINYSNLLTNYEGNPDYARRWQHLGDETKTSVPSLIYTPNVPRDAFYSYSTVLVERADQIRLQDISVAYEVDLSHGRKQLSYRHLRVYGYVAGFGPIWTANKLGIDPDYVGVPKDGKRFSVGASLSL